jgi:hypothetical protein
MNIKRTTPKGNKTKRRGKGPTQGIPDRLRETVRIQFEMHAGKKRIEYFIKFYKNIAEIDKRIKELTEIKTGLNSAFGAEKTHLIFRDLKVARMYLFKKYKPKK